MIWINQKNAAQEYPSQRPLRPKNCATASFSMKAMKLFSLPLERPRCRLVKAAWIVSATSNRSFNFSSSLNCLGAPLVLAETIGKVERPGGVLLNRRLCVSPGAKETAHALGVCICLCLHLSVLHLFLHPATRNRILDWIERKYWVAQSVWRFCMAAWPEALASKGKKTKRICNETLVIRSKALSRVKTPGKSTAHQ